MTGFDRRRQGRYAGGRMAAPQREIGPHVAGRAADASRDSSADAGVVAAPAAEMTGGRTAHLPSGPFDAPYAHFQSAVFPAQAVRVCSGEAIAAITGFSMLAEALRQLGLQTETRGYVMTVWQPGGNGQASRYEVVVLGHHPHHGGRLWWWRLTAGSVSPDGQWGPQAMLRAIGPVDEIPYVADHLARALRVNAEDQRVGQHRTARPAHDWPIP